MVKVERENKLRSSRVFKASSVAIFCLLVFWTQMKCFNGKKKEREWASRLRLSIHIWSSLSRSFRLMLRAGEASKLEVVLLLSLCDWSDETWAKKKKRHTLLVSRQIWANRHKLTRLSLSYDHHARADHLVPTSLVCIFNFHRSSSSFQQICLVISAANNLTHKMSQLFNINLER